MSTPFPQQVKGRRERIRDLWAAGLDARTIADYLGCSRGTVWRAANDHLWGGGRMLSPKEHEVITRSFRGESVKRIVKAMKVSVQFVLHARRHPAWNRKRYIATRNAQIIGLAQRKASTRRIARIHNITVERVRQVLAQAGVPRRDRTMLAERNARILARYNRGERVRSIIRDERLAESTIHEILKAQRRLERENHQLPANPNPRPQTAHRTAHQPAMGR